MKATSVTRFAHDSIYYHFQAVFPASPDVKDIIQAQDEAGYNPFGYGSPFDVHIQGNVAVWKCFNSCD